MTPQKGNSMKFIVVFFAVFTFNLWAQQNYFFDDGGGSETKAQKLVSLSFSNIPYMPKNLNYTLKSIRAHLSILPRGNNLNGAFVYIESDDSSSISEFITTFTEIKMVKGGITDCFETAPLENIACLKYEFLSPTKVKFSFRGMANYKTSAYESISFEINYNSTTKKVDISYGGKSIKEIKMTTSLTKMSGNALAIAANADDFHFSYQVLDSHNIAVEKKTFYPLVGMGVSDFTAMLKGN